MKNKIIIKLILLIILAVGLGLGGNSIGLNSHQALAVSIFSMSIMGSLFFWDFRLSFAFLGISILLLTKTIDLEHMVRFSSLEIILFLTGMMVIIGLLKEVGFFAWILSLLMRIRTLTATKFVILISITSALSACIVDEVTSIIFVVVAVLEICDYFEVDPIPYILISVLTTNIGSAGTVLGNPIGILIASKAGLTFEDFIKKAFPIMIFTLLTTIGLILVIYRSHLKKLDRKIKEFGPNEIFIRLISVPPEPEVKIGLVLFGLTLFFIALHHRLETILGLPVNTILLTSPLIFGGIAMIWKWTKARGFIEKDVEWWTLLFFLLLFAQAGTLHYTGATDVLAKKLAYWCQQSHVSLIGAVLWISAIGSSMLDNVVLVAAFIPIIQSFQDMGINVEPLWWALLFGGCLGGNITIIGSTANIVALGILEKEKRIKITFLRWVKIGSLVGIFTTSLVWLILSLFHVS